MKMIWLNLKISSTLNLFYYFLTFHSWELLFSFLKWKHRLTAKSFQTLLIFPFLEKSWCSMDVPDVVDNSDGSSSVWYCCYRLSSPGIYWVLVFSRRWLDQNPKNFDSDCSSVGVFQRSLCLVAELPHLHLHRLQILRQRWN